MVYQLTIPEKHYLGMRYQEGSVPLGFVTPWKGLKTDPTKPDGQTRGRMNTVDGWTNGNYYNKGDNINLATHVIDNVPLSGFKTAQSFKRGGSWGAASAIWRIEDPRGFELEISNGNMIEIMLCTTVVEGEIHAPCVWGRCGSENVLIPIDSDEYKEAKINTELVKETVLMKDVSFGNKIVLTNGKIGTYLGSYYTLQLESNYDSSNRRAKTLGWSKSKKHILELDNYSGYVAEADKEYALFTTSFKISKILDDSTITAEDAIEKINNGLISDDLKFIDGFGYIKYIIMGVSGNKVDLKLTTTEITEDDIKDKVKAYYTNNRYHINTKDKFIMVVNKNKNICGATTFNDYGKGAYNGNRTYNRSSMYNNDDTKFTATPFDLKKLLEDADYDTTGSIIDINKDDKDNSFFLVDVTFKDKKTNKEFTTKII